MLTRSTTLTDDELMRRVRLADPLAAGDPHEPDADAILDRVLSQPGGEPRRPFTQPRFRAALLAAIVAGALLVPAAVAFHRQLLDALQSTDDPPSPYDLAGAWSAPVSRLGTPGLNGRWTIRFTLHPDRPGFGGEYSRSRNGKPVASGSFSFTYSSIGPMIGLRDMDGPGRCTERIIGGVYLVHLEQKVLTLTPMTPPSSDSCRKRLAVLADRPFRR